MSHIELTAKLVISALMGGVLVFPFLRMGLSKDEETRIGWMFLAAAITTFVFFEVVMIILAVVAGFLAFCRIAPIMSKAGSEAVGEIIQQFNGANSPRLTVRDKVIQDTKHLEGQVPDDVLEEQRQHLIEHYRSQA